MSSPATEHLQRITSWVEKSIEAGGAVLLYLRGYRRTDRGRPNVTFGHHVVLRSLEGARFTFLDSGPGRVDHGELRIAESEFAAPTFTYRFDGDRALTTETLQRGRPLLEVRVPSYGSDRKTILVAHFATFASD